MCRRCKETKKNEPTPRKENAQTLSSNIASKNTTWNIHPKWNTERKGKGGRKDRFPHKPKTKKQPRKKKNCNSHNKRYRVRVKMPKWTSMKQERCQMPRHQVGNRKKREGGEEEGWKQRVEKEKPQDNAPKKIKIKKPLSPLPASYTAEYIDPNTGQTVRKLAITSAEKSFPSKESPEKSTPRTKFL